tara:strand:- start:43006 stop:43362 length:357 start_codon:yes stop_codon:yes gene_type:complete
MPLAKFGRPRSLGPIAKIGGVDPVLADPVLADPVLAAMLPADAVPSEEFPADEMHADSIPSWMTSVLAVAFVLGIESINVESAKAQSWSIKAAASSAPPADWIKSFSWAISDSLRGSL